MNEVLYRSIVDSIKQRIHSGELKPGDMLASEASLVQEFGVSRMTVRKSLSLLASEGYIYSVAGKGSFVCTPEVNSFRMRFSRYEDLATEIDDVRLLGVNVGRGPQLARERLKVAENELVLQADRLLLSGEQRVALEALFFLYLPNLPVVEERLRFTNQMDKIEKRLAFTLEKHLTIKGAVADELTARHLEVAVGEPLLLIEEETVDLEGNSIYLYSEMLLPPRFFHLEATTENDENALTRKAF